MKENQNNSFVLLKNLAPKVLAAILASKPDKGILLHCHRSPDPDSVCSALAMKEALEQLFARKSDKDSKDFKKITIIRGDSEIPQAFMHFPGAKEIMQKNFFEIDLADFDLFIALDSGSLGMISDVQPIVFPETLQVIAIDHHISNVGYGKINLIDPTYVSTCQLLADLFDEWISAEAKLDITHDMAMNMLIGMHTDSGGYRFGGKYSPHLFEVAARLSKIAPDFTDAIFLMENSAQPQELAFQGLVLSNIQTYLGGKLAISAVTLADMQAHAIDPKYASTYMSSNLITVPAWQVGVCMVEKEPGNIKMSFRTRDSEKLDVSIIASRLGGGGHKAAAGARVAGTLDEVRKQVIDAVAKSM